MQIDRARANRATAGQRDNGMTIPRQHGTKNQDRGAHFAHNVIIGGVVGNGMRGHGQHLTILQRRDLSPQRPQKLGHGANIRQARGIGQRQRLIAEQGCGHQREAGVLRSGDRNHPLQRAIALHQNRIHLLVLLIVVRLDLGPRFRLYLTPGHIGLERGFQPVIAAFRLRRAGFGRGRFAGVVLHGHLHSAAGKNRPEGMRKASCAPPKLRLITRHARQDTPPTRPGAAVAQW